MLMLHLRDISQMHVLPVADDNTEVGSLPEIDEGHDWWLQYATINLQTGQTNTFHCVY